MGLFGAAHRWGGSKKFPISKISHTYITMMKLGTLIAFLKKIQKYINHKTHPSSSADISIFLPEINKFCYIKKYRYRFYFGTLFLILLTFFESFKIFLLNMVIVLMISTKIDTQGLLKIKICWNKCCDVTTFFLWHYQQKFIMWLKLYFGCGYLRSYRNLNFIRTWPEKPFFEG